jgi:flagellin-like protein
MRKKSRKALSPVIASIILIAVTVAVSIAVAAWMGALTFGFMGSSSLTITNVAFNGNSGNATNTIVLSIKNTGTKTVTVGSVKINNVAVPAANIDAGSLLTYTTSAPNNIGTITINSANWISGSPYQFNLYDTSGNGIGSYQVNSPGS